MELKSITGAVIFALESAKTVHELVSAAVEAKKSLRGADLRGAYLGGAYLRGADLRGADLGGAYLRGADLRGADLGDAYLRGADLRGANLRGADLGGAYLRGADLGADLGGAYLGAYLGADLGGADLGADLGGADLGADLGGADLGGKKIRAIRVFSGLYSYEVWAVLFEDGTRMVRMGCFSKTLEEWEEIGIRASNPSEFPNDGSEKCEERVAAFEFAKAAVLRLK
jgi:hypothetical protein